jgi:inner membrane protein
MYESPTPQLGMFARMMQSNTVKIFILAALTLLLMIPLALVRGVLNERQGKLREAEYEVSKGKGGAQTISPPFLVVQRNRPVVRVINGLETAGIEEQDHILLADTAVSKINLSVSPLTINTIYTIPTFTASTTITGSFALEDLIELTNLSGMQLDTVRLGFVAGDLNGVGRVSSFKIANVSVKQTALGKVFDSYSMLGGKISSISQPNLGSLLMQEAISGKRAIPFEMTLDFNGVDSISTLPLARQLNQSMKGNWPWVSFVAGDGVSPTTRRVGQKDFEATWSVAEFNRDFPQIALRNRDSGALRERAMTVGLMRSSDIYTLNDRAGKYGVLFVAMTIAGFFLVEVLLRVRLHPMHYVQIGLALGLFYLMLLAFSEHWGFARAYLIAAGGITLAVSGYTSAILKSHKRGAVAAGMMGMVYGFLYFLLAGDRYSLAMGATGLFLLLSASMYLTRDINWSADGASSPK